MRPLLRDAWVLLGLSFGQIFLTFVIVGFVPYGYLTSQAKSNTSIAQSLQKLNDFAQENMDTDLTGPQLVEQMGPTFRFLMESVPWTWLAVAGSIVIYPFLGWWSGRLLHNPQAGGILIFISILTGQNLATIPGQVEHHNLADIGLSLTAIVILIAWQFLLLTAGIFVQRGQYLLQTTKETKK